MIRSLRVGLLAVLVALPACQPRVEAATAAQGVEAEVRARSQALDQAEQRQDLDAILPFYAEDAIFHVEAVPPVQGRAGIRQLYAEFFQLPLVTSVSTITTVVVARSGDLAYESGANEFVFDAGGRRITSRGKYLGVWRRGEDGQWRIAAASFSNDQPISP